MSVSYILIQRLQTCWKRKSLKRKSLEAFVGRLLDYQDSNLDKQNQNLLCYHYTIVQTLGAFC